MNLLKSRSSETWFGRLSSAVRAPKSETTSEEKEGGRVRGYKCPGEMSTQNQRRNERRTENARVRNSRRTRRSILQTLFRGAREDAGRVRARESRSFRRHVARVCTQRVSTGPPLLLLLLHLHLLLLLLLLVLMAIRMGTPRRDVRHRGIPHTTRHLGPGS